MYQKLTQLNSKKLPPKTNNLIIKQAKVTDISRKKTHKQPTTDP